MRKFFGFGSQKISVITQESNGADSAPEYSSKISSGPKYHIRDKDLRKIHKAASAGNIPKLQKILLRKEKCLNDRDKKNRTALHLACANGHPEVVTFLTDNKCELNFCDNDNRTALIKAIQCQHEECASILLKCGADPNVADIDGNTALHFAVAGHNVEMAEELLLNKADIEAKNKDDLTPLLLAIHEHKYKMAKFLMKNNANIHAIDRFKRTSLMLAVNDSSTELVKLLLQEGVNVLAEDINGHTAEEHALKTGLTFNYKLIHDYKEEEICKQLSQKSSQDTNLQDATELSKNKSSVADSLKFYPWSKHVAEVTDPVSKKEVQMEAPQTSRSVHEKSKEDSASSKPQMENLWSSGDSEELSFHAKNVVNPSLAKIKTVVQQSLRNIGRKYGNLSTVKKGNESDSENEVSENKVMVDTLAKPSAAIQNWSHPAFPSTGPLVKPSVKSLAVIGLPEEEAIKPVIGKKENGMDVSEWAPREQTNKNNVNYVDGMHENNTSGSLENFPHLKPTTEVKDSVPKKAVELKGIQTSKPDLSAELVLGRMSEKDHKGLDGSKKNHSQDFSASLPIRCAVGLTGAADQKGKNIQKEQEAVPEKSKEDSASSKPQMDNSWSSGDSEELSFHTKNVVNPSLAKIKTVVQQSLRNIGRKYGNLSTIKKGNESDSENEVSENKVMVDTLAKPSAAIQNWSHPAFPSTGPLVKPSVKSLAVIGLPEEEAIKPVIGKKENGMDVSEWAPREQTNKNNVNYVDGMHENNTSGSLENFPHLKPTTEVKDSVPKKAVELKGIQTSKPDLSAELVLGRMSEKDHKGLDGSKNNHSQDFSASLPIRCAVDLTGAADQKGKNIQKEQEAVRGSSEEESVSRKPQINDSWSSGDSEELSFHPKNVMNPNLEKIKTIVQRSLKNIEEKCATLSTEKDNEADSENEVSENKVMVETPAKPSAAIQNWSHPAFPSPGPLVKPSVKSLAVIGLPEEEAIKPVIGNKKNVKISALGIGDEEADSPWDSEEEAIKPGIGNKENGMDISEQAPREQTNSDRLNYVNGAHTNNISVKMPALGIEDKEADSPWDSEDFSTNRPINCADDLPGAADQGRENIQKEQRADLSAGLVVGRTSEQEQKGLDESKNNHSQDFAASLPLNCIDDLPGAAEQGGENIQKEQRAGSLENYPLSKPTIEVKDSVSKKAVEKKGSQSSRSESSHLNSASLPLNHETCQGSGDLKIHTKFVSQSMTPKQPASTDIGHMTLTDKYKTNIGAVFLRGDERLHDLCEPQLPENRGSKEDLLAELVLGRTSEKEQKGLDGSKNNHSQEEAIKPGIGNKENGMDISEQAPREQTNSDRLNYVNGAHTNNISVEMSALGIEDEEAASPGDSEDFAASLPINCIDDLPGAADQKGENIRKEQVAGSLENYPLLKPTIEVKDSVPKKAIEVMGMQSSRSDSSYLESASLPLDHETCQGSGDLKVYNTLAFVSQSMTPKQPASTDIGHMTLTDKCKTNIGAVFLRGDERLHDLCEPQLPENRRSKEDLSAGLVIGRTSEQEHKGLDGSKNNHSQIFSASVPKKYVDHLSEDEDQRGKNRLSGQVEGSLEKYPVSKPTIEVKYPVSKEAVGMKETQTSRSDSLGRYHHLKPAVQMKAPVSKKAVEMKATQTSRSDSSDLDSARSSLKHRRSQKPRDLNIDVQYPLVSHSITPNPSAFTDIGHTTIVDKKKMNIGAVLLIGDHRVHYLRELQLAENRESKEDSLEKYPHLKHIVKSKDPVPKKAVGMKATQTSRSDSLETYPHLKPAVKVKDPVPREAVGTDTQSSGSESVSLLKMQDAVMSDESLIELKKNHCELLTGKIKTMENKVIGLQKELSQTKEMKSQLEHQKVEWEHELCNLRFTLQQEKEKRENTDMLYKKVREQLIKKEEQYHKEVEMKQQLEITLRILSIELKTVRNNFNQVVEELNDTQRQLSHEQNARISQDAVLTNHLCKQKAIEINLKKMNSEVSDSHAKESDLLRENHMLQDEIAMLRLEVDTVKNQKQEMEKKYLEDITIVKEKNDQLQKTVKLNEETLTKTIFQYTGQLNVLTAENTMLNSKLENEKQNKDRLETEVESYRSRLATAVHDHEQGQMSKRDSELAFQRARDEWFRLRDKMDFDMSNLKDNNEILSQQLSKARSKLNSLDIELHHKRDALREKTLVLERVQTDLSQIQCQKKEIERMYQNEQGKVNKYIGKQESLEERFSHLQSENALLRQQLDDARSKIDSNEKTVIHIQDQFQNIVKTLQAESERQGRMLEERNKELINECNHLKERMYQYENDKAEREVVVRQLQQELADTLKKQSMSEASLEVTARYRMTLEDEAQDLKKKLNQVRSQLQEANDQHAEAVRCAEKTKDHMQKLETENAELKITVEKQASKIEQLQKNLLSTSSSENKEEQPKDYIELKQSLEYSFDQEKKKNGELEKEIIRLKKLLKFTRRKLDEYENGELRFPGDLKPSHVEIDVQIKMLKEKIDDLTAKLKTSSLKCLRLEEENQILRQESSSMKGIQKECEVQENEKKQLKQQLINLKSHVEMNMVEYSEIEKYKREIEEKARQEIVEKLKEVNLFLQAQAVAQENLDQLRESNSVSIRSQMERRIKELESELSKIKTSQEESNKAEVEKYKQLYMEELKSRQSLASKLNKTDEKLAEMSTKLLVKKQQNKSLLSSLITRPVLEPQGVGSLNYGLISHSNLTPRENLVTSVSTPGTSTNSLETYLSKVQHEFEKNLTGELKEAAAEFESEPYRPFFPRSTDGSNLYQDLGSKTSQEYAQILKKNYMI